MRDCHACQRPVGRGWLICGWCGTSQVVKARKQRTFRQFAGLALLLQALGIVGGTVALAVIWSGTGWSMERAQTLGVIWVGVLVILGFLGWASVHIARPHDQAPLFAPRDRQTT